MNHYVNKAAQTLPASLLLPFTRPLQRISTYKNLFTSLQREPEECLPCQIPQCCLLGLTVLLTQATTYQSEKTLDSEAAEQNFLHPCCYRKTAKMKRKKKKPTYFFFLFPLYFHSVSVSFIRKAVKWNYSLLAFQCFWGWVPHMVDINIPSAF